MVERPEAHEAVENEGLEDFAVADAGIPMPTHR
jgi:hypothetical protein